MFILYFCACIFCIFVCVYYKFFSVYLTHLRDLPPPPPPAQNTANCARSARANHCPRSALGIVDRLIQKSARKMKIRLNSDGRTRLPSLSLPSMHSQEWRPCPPSILFSYLRRTDRGIGVFRKKWLSSLDPSYNHSHRRESTQNERDHLLPSHS